MNHLTRVLGMGDIITQSDVPVSVGRGHWAFNPLMSVGGSKTLHKEMIKLFLVLKWNFPDKGPCYGTALGSVNEVHILYPKEKTKILNCFPELSPFWRNAKIKILRKNKLRRNYSNILFGLVILSANVVNYDLLGVVVTL